MSGDLHSNKKSHFSLPIDKGVEIHLNNKDLKHKQKVKLGDKYTASMPVIVTSADGHHSRFKQTDKMSVDKAVKGKTNKMFKLDIKSKRGK